MESSSWAPLFLSLVGQGLFNSVFFKLSWPASLSSLPYSVLDTSGIARTEKVLVLHSKAFGQVVLLTNMNASLQKFFIVHVEIMTKD
jgi:hypothetical protein